MRETGSRELGRRLYDCDFNQMLEAPIGAAHAGGPRTIWEINDGANVRAHRDRLALLCVHCGRRLELRRRAGLRGKEKLATDKTSNPSRADLLRLTAADRAL